jgi:serine/threonine protein phosphatase PrpC
MNVVSVDDNTLLALEFDGHGREGHHVVNFCRSEAVAAFKTNKKLIQDDPRQFILNLTNSCDAKLKEFGSGVDASYSGTTAVAVLIQKDRLYCAGIGDSRAVLGTSKPPEIVYAEQPPRGEDRMVLENVMRRRSVQVDHPLEAVQLTKDQKPEDPEELDRITKSGGVVRRLLDENGRNIGPWRVWRKDCSYPGLAMSRSLGDAVGAEIGVISVPHFSIHSIQEEDAFIVCASDGLWDVMENSEVVDFVEAYRHSCIRGTFSEINNGILTKPENATIAQLLCEEARMRWLSIVEDEDVVIDDISCVVLEFRDSDVQIVQPPDRSTYPNMDGQDVPELETQMGVPRSEVRLRDPRRASVSD